MHYTPKRERTLLGSRQPQIPTYRGMSQPIVAVSMNPLDVRDPQIDGPQGDAIPFFHEGRYHLFYLEAPAGKYDQPDRGRTPWRHVVSDNLVDWQDLGIALPLGEGDDPDIDGIWTGSIIAVDGVLHVFYTGGRRVASIPQTVCHATSTDGVLFTKSPANPIHFPGATGSSNVTGGILSCSGTKSTSNTGC